MASRVDADRPVSLKELKEVIFDLDWEISDQSLDKLSSVISFLKEKWKDRKPHLVCLRIIDNVGYYVKRAKHKAHPEAVKLLSSVFKILEEIDSNDNLTEADRVNLVRVELEKYNGLKGEITGEAKKTERKISEKEKPKPQSTGGEPVASAVSAERGSAEREEREIVSTRLEDQSFPEAEELLDDFFAEEAQDQAAKPEKLQDIGEAAEEKEDVVEFELGGKDNDKRVANIFGATETELEAQIGEKLGLREKKNLKGREESESGPGSSPQDESDKKLDAIVDQFSREVTSLIVQELRKAIREEIARVQ
ncbi:MAG: hypothetical protein ACQES8_07440 [Thermodesulfobacteriota bacterium]